mmetsp:Transcript_42202/g.134006  ORF Transcript_42202/g.134006 Transcript_42202/m.134006 type:complete len:222 (+) Transcript_42202:542-1207(+)
MAMAATLCLVAVAPRRDAAAPRAALPCRARWENLRRLLPAGATLARAQHQAAPPGRPWPAAASTDLPPRAAQPRALPGHPCAALAWMPPGPWALQFAHLGGFAFPGGLRATSACSQGHLRCCWHGSLNCRCCRRRRPARCGFRLVARPREPAARAAAPRSPRSAPAAPSAGPPSPCRGPARAWAAGRPVAAGLTSTGPACRAPRPPHAPCPPPCCRPLTCA